MKDKTMKLQRAIKKCLSVMLVSVLFFSATQAIPAHAAATISQLSVSKPGYGYVRLTSGTLNVRKTASTSASVVASLNNESWIMIVGQSGNFYKVQYDTAGHYGYVSKSYVEFGNFSYYLRTNISSGTLNMRSGAGSSPIIASIPKDKYFAHVADMPITYWMVYGNKSGHTAPKYTTRYKF